MSASRSSSLMSALISRRTTSPKRRRRSSASTASSRSSASSETSKSASRVTRNTPLSTTSIPGKSACRCAAMTCSSATNVRPSSPTGRKRGSISFGTFTRANVRTPVCGSRTRTASDSDRLEMYGNGRPTPTASGVSTGKIWRLKRSASCSPCSSERSSSADDVDAVLGQLRAQPPVEGARLAVAQVDDPLAQLVDHLRRRPAVRARVAEAGVDLVVQAGDADHEELVEVRAEDRRELQPLEQRLVGLLGELEDALVERQPGELAVVVELGIVEVGRRRRLGDGRRDRSDRLLLGHREAAGDAMATRRASLLPSCEGPVTGLAEATRSLAAYCRRARNPSRSRRVHISRKRW